MNTSETYTLLQESDNPFISLTLSKIKPQLRMRKVLQIEKDKNLTQMSKRRSSTLDKLTLYDGDLIALFIEKEIDLINQVSQISKLKVNLKKLKSLKHLDINMNWVIQLDNQGFYKFFESLKHLKGLSVLHFYAIGFPFPWGWYLERIQYLSQWIHLFPKTEIRLSLPEISSDQAESLDAFERFIKSVSEHKKFTSACLDFPLFNSELIQRFISLFKGSKSVTRLSLALQYCYQSSEIESFLLILTEITLPKYLTISFKEYRPTYSELKRYLPLLKKIAENSHLEIVFETLKNENIGTFECWLFKRSIKKLNSSHPIHVMFLGITRILGDPGFYICEIPPKWIVLFACFLCLIVAWIGFQF